MRVMVVWCPDWSVVAALEEADRSLRSPAAVLSANVVEVCNGPARAEGVRRGQRRRDAQARCPELLLLPTNPDRDARAFEPVLAVVEYLRPGVAALRPGLLAVRAPGSWYGSPLAYPAVLPLSAYTAAMIGDERLVPPYCAHVLPVRRVGA